ncbi:hypothetical protein SKAU_G00330370 [Synaphobranchus kaupii]|uniref:Uncharacterized protein n=1 Tax=Synaphobranchus kaupii TaxID=118154 RepID=A0A9Q1IKT1_SYNKA|nr:hypothetical protein SKAU_G00330370 [Synaphobranchus kaupii]
MVNTGAGACGLRQTGKILVLKAIVLPIFLYLGRVFPPDRATGKNITRMAFRFVWGSTMEKLKRATLLKEEKNGVRGVPDIVNIILVQGLATLVQNTQKVEKASGTFARYYATPFLRAMGQTGLGACCFLCLPKQVAAEVLPDC